MPRGPGKEGEAGPGEASRCVKCGTCMAVCPLYELKREEQQSPRGKLALIEAVGEGAIAESPRFRRYLETCLLCASCQEACPIGVGAFETFLHARRRVAERKGMGAGKGLVLKHLLRAAWVFRAAVRTGGLVQRLAFARIPADSGLRRRIPLPLVAHDRLVPPVSPQFFTELFDGVVREGEGPRVGIFAGCMVNYFFPAIGEEMVRLLGVFEATVVVPPGQACCGMPALTGGAHATAVDLARRNLEAFEQADLDAVVTGCASCGHNIKAHYRSLLAEAGVSPQRAERFVSRVLDFNEFLARSGFPGFLRQAGAGEGQVRKVTYHHPCHLGRLQGIRAEPLDLIRSLPGVVYLAMKDPDRCCGMGGSFSVEHYGLAKQVNDAKILDIKGTGARIVVTSCPACILHIRDGLRRNGVEGVEVLHIAELLARAVRPAEQVPAEDHDHWAMTQGDDSYDGV